MIRSYNAYAFLSKREKTQGLWKIKVEKDISPN
jgi:hypothetical protein